VRYVQRPEWESVVDLIVLDGRNPRSAHFQLSKIAKHVRLLPNAETSDLPGEVDRLIATCRGAEEWRGEGHGSGRDRRIEPLLLGVERLAARLSDMLTLRYFSHVDDQPRDGRGMSARVTSDRHETRYVHDGLAPRRSMSRVSSPPLGHQRVVCTR
jgi:hypothetical protein